MKKHNYSAGPCFTTRSFEKSAQAILNFNDLDYPFRNVAPQQDFVAVMEEARTIVLELLGLEGKVIKPYLSGEALEFIMVPYNLMKEGGKAAYLDTGTWAAAAIKTKLLEKPLSLLLQKKTTIIFKRIYIPTDADYFHCTSNNTILVLK
jgi:phosphoserine aminotransferase